MIHKIITAFQFLSRTSILIAKELQNDLNVYVLCFLSSVSSARASADSGVFYLHTSHSYLRGGHNYVNIASICDML